MSRSLITLKLVISEAKKAVHDLRASFPAAVTPFVLVFRFRACPCQ